MSWWTRAALVLGVGLPLMGVFSFWLLIDLVNDDRECCTIFPDVVWRPGEPKRGDLVALTDYKYRVATMVGEPGDEIRALLESPSPVRLVVSGPGGRSSVLELGPREDAYAFPARVPPGTLLIHDLYYGANGDSGTEPVTGLVGKRQVIGVVLTHWQTDATYGAGTVAAALWLASVAFLVGRLSLRALSDEHSRERDLFPASRESARIEARDR